MEPRVIDFYNEMPSGVYVIEEMNKELDEIQKENIKLKKKISDIEKKNPKIIFKNKQEFLDKHQIMYRQIKEKLSHCFSDFEYKQMRNLGITTVFAVGITNCIQIELQQITGDKVFSYNQSYKIMKLIKCMFSGLEMPHWLIIYNCLTKEQLIDIFYYQIVNYIEEYIISEYSLFKCFKCDKIDNYVNDENWCVNCYNPDVYSDSSD